MSKRVIILIGILTVLLGVPSYAQDSTYLWVFLEDVNGERISVNDAQIYINGDLANDAYLVEEGLYQVENLQIGDKVHAELLMESVVEGSERKARNFGDQEEEHSIRDLFASSSYGESYQPYIHENNISNTVYLPLTSFEWRWNIFIGAEDDLSNDERILAIKAITQASRNLYKITDTQSRLGKMKFFLEKPNDNDYLLFTEDGKVLHGDKYLSEDNEILDAVPVMDSVDIIIRDGTGQPNAATYGIYSDNLNYVSKYKDDRDNEKRIHFPRIEMFSTLWLNNSDRVNLDSEKYSEYFTHELFHYLYGFNEDYANVYDKPFGLFDSKYDGVMDSNWGFKLQLSSYKSHLPSILKEFDEFYSMYDLSKDEHDINRTAYHSEKKYFEYIKENYNKKLDLENLSRNELICQASMKDIIHGEVPEESFYAYMLNLFPVARLPLEIEYESNDDVYIIPINYFSTNHTYYGQYNQ